MMGGFVNGLLGILESCGEEFMETGAEKFGEFKESPTGP